MKLTMGNEKAAQEGQSIVEIVIALAIFLIIVGSGVVTVLGSLSISKLGSEESQATAMAVEGLEAVTSIRNRDWNNLSTGTRGLVNNEGFWAFNGISDMDALGKFTRSVTISVAERDFDGNIVTEGGSPDLDTLLINSKVTWDFTPSRQNEVEMTTYLTNWSESVYVKVSGN